MPARFLSAAERDRLRRFPDVIPPDDLLTYFTLLEQDLDEVNGTGGPITVSVLPSTCVLYVTWDLVPTI